MSDDEQIQLADNRKLDGERGLILRWGRQVRLPNRRVMIGHVQDFEGTSAVMMVFKKLVDRPSREVARTEVLLSMDSGAALLHLLEEFHEYMTEIAVEHFEQFVDGTEQEDSP